MGWRRNRLPGNEAVCDMITAHLFYGNVTPKFILAINNRMRRPPRQQGVKVKTVKVFEEAGPYIRLASGSLARCGGIELEDGGQVRRQVSDFSVMAQV